MRLPIRPGAVVIGVACVSVLLASAAQPATAGALGPTNDNFLFAVNVNNPGTALNATEVLRSVTETIGATTQPNILSPCKPGTRCRVGPAEVTSCHGVPYGSTVWYDFYPDHDGQVEIRTTGIPNVIALYTYDPRTLIPTEGPCASGSGYPGNDLFAYVHRGLDYTFQVGGTAGATGLLRMRFKFAYRSSLTVAKFLIRPVFSGVLGNPNATRLLRLNLVGLRQGEGAAAACSGCGGATFGPLGVVGKAPTLSASTPIRGTASTRITVGVFSPAQIGRYRIYRVAPSIGQVIRLTTGCLVPGVTSVPAFPIGNGSSPGTMPCPTPRLVNTVGAEYVFWKGIDRRLHERWYSGADWSRQSTLPARTVDSPPTVAVHADGEQDVFWKGAGGHLWEIWYTGQWNGPRSLGGRLGSAPSAGVDSDGDEFVFWRGVDGRLTERVFEHGVWSTELHPGSRRIASPPSVAVHADGEQDVFWRGSDGRLWEMWYTGSWSRAIPLGGGQLGSAPSAAVDGSGDEYVVWRGNFGGLREMSYAQHAWSSSVPLPVAGVRSAPAVAVHADGEQDVFWQDARGGLSEVWFAGQWNGPRSLGGRLATPPAAGIDAISK